MEVFTKLKEGALLPEYKTSGSAGADLRALIEEPIILKPMQRCLIPTGLSVELPKGIELQVRPRSGLKHSRHCRFGLPRRARRSFNKSRK